MISQKFIPSTAAALVALLGACASPTGNKSPVTIGVRGYGGEISSHRVEILEFLHEGDPTWTRFVTIEDVGSCTSSFWCGISAIDDDFDGDWDHIIWCGPTYVSGSSCEGVDRVEGAWVPKRPFGPASTAHTFTEAQIEDALALLKQAMEIRDSAEALKEGLPHD